MVTTVGTESRFADLLTNLIRLERDAVAAYEACIDRLDDTEDGSQVSRFLEDHNRHLKELTGLARSVGSELPSEGGVKQLLTSGKLALANLMGDSALLRAMATNEDDTVTAYERARQHGEAPPEAREIFERAHADEVRHRAWMEAAAKTK